MGARKEVEKERLTSRKPHYVEDNYLIANIYPGFPVDTVSFSGTGWPTVYTGYARSAAYTAATLIYI